MISISGVRGIIGDSLTPELVMRMGEAFGTYLASGSGGSPRVVVGRDTRVSGEMVKHSVLAGLLSTGCSIVDLGVATTPTAAMMVRELGAAGAVVISASHNPVEWNALKFFGPDGIYLDAGQGRSLLDLYYQGDFRRARWSEIRAVEKNEAAGDAHLRRVLAVVDVELIRSRHFKVALDSCNGAGAEITAKLLDTLGCEAVRIHCTPDGLFPHDPEPSFLNLQDLCRVAGQSGVDAAFAQDPDADRLAVVDERGRFIGEEYTLALAADYVLSRLDGAGKRGGSRRGGRGRSGTRPAAGREPVVVINISSSRAVEDIAERHGARCERVPVGEVNVALRMREVGAVIGGEGNGGVIDPRVHLGRDSLTGIALILEHMARSGRKLSQLVAALPRYSISKAKVDLDRRSAAEAVAALAARSRAAGVRVSTEDGLRLDWPAHWVHIRSSNTEPVVRVIAEARDEAGAVRLVKKYSADLLRLAGRGVS
jgi:phosphomannomutase